jgi:hypothetical protein
MSRNKAKKFKWEDLSAEQKARIVIMGLVQITLLVVALVDIRRRPAHKINGSKALWTALAFVNYIGPISYFVFGRKR